MSAPRAAARVVVWAASTLTTLVLLLSYPTSDGSWLDGGGTAVVAAGDPGTASAAQASTTSTYDGAAVQTRWGTVQVQVVVTDGALADVVALQLPSENGRDREINARAEPLLRQEAVAAGSADIDVVTGATVTSQGYVASLQSALDAAGLQP